MPASTAPGLTVVERLIPIAPAADSVGKHPETLRRWVRAGRLPAYRLGREYLIDPADLAGLIQPVRPAA